MQKGKVSASWKFYQNVVLSCVFFLDREKLSFKKWFPLFPSFSEFWVFHHPVTGVLRNLSWFHSRFIYNSFAPSWIFQEAVWGYPLLLVFPVKLHFSLIFLTSERGKNRKGSWKFTWHFFPRVWRGCGMEGWSDELTKCKTWKGQISCIQHSGFRVMRNCQLLPKSSCTVESPQQSHCITACVKKMVEQYVVWSN